MTFAVFMQSAPADCSEWVGNSSNIVVFSDASARTFTSWFGMARPQHYVIDKRGTFTLVDPNDGDCGQCGSWDDATYSAAIKSALSPTSPPPPASYPSPRTGNPAPPIAEEDDGGGGGGGASNALSSTASSPSPPSLSSSSRVGTAASFRWFLLLPAWVAATVVVELYR